MAQVGFVVYVGPCDRYEDVFRQGSFRPGVSGERYVAPVRGKSWQELAEVYHAAP
jgi:hypothetical protein